MPQGHRRGRDGARGRHRDPRLLLRAAARAAARRLPHVSRARSRGCRSSRRPARSPPRTGWCVRTAADEREGELRPGRRARVHPPEPPARLPRLRQGRRVPAPGPDLPLRARRSTRMAFAKRTFDKPIPVSPLIALDRERCILCYRCTRFSESVAEDGQLVAVDRGANSYIATFEDEPYRAHFSGNVIELCPVGALTSTVYRFRARPWEIQNVPTVCGLCPVGCNTWATTREGKVVRACSRRNHPEVDEGWLCDKGRFAHDHLARRTTAIRERDRARRARAALTRGLAGARRSTSPRRDCGGAAAPSSSRSRAARRSSRPTRSRGSCARASARTRRSLPDDPRPGARRVPRAAVGDPRRPSSASSSATSPSSSARPSSTSGSRAARRAGAEIVTVHPAGTVRVPPGSAARVCAALASEIARPRSCATLARRLREADRVALVWSGDDATGGRHLAALAARARARRGLGRLLPAAHAERPRRRGGLARRRRGSRRRASGRGRDRRADRLRRRGALRPACRSGSPSAPRFVLDDRDVHDRGHGLVAPRPARDGLPRARRHDRQPRGTRRSACGGRSRRRGLGRARVLRPPGAALRRRGRALAARSRRRARAAAAALRPPAPSSPRARAPCGRLGAPASQLVALPAALLGRGRRTRPAAPVPAPGRRGRAPGTPDARARGIATGDAVRVRSNGTSRELTRASTVACGRASRASRPSTPRGSATMVEIEKA